MTTTKKTNKEKIMEILESMSVIELAELTKELEEKFGVSAQAMIVPQGVPAVAQTIPTTAEAPAEEKTEFDVMLSTVGAKKIQVIKVIRAITGLGLKEAKELVDNAPQPIKTGISKSEAEDIKSKIEEVGATVEIK